MKRTITVVLALAAIVVPTAIADSPATRIDAHTAVGGNDTAVVGTLVPPDRVDGKSTAATLPTAHPRSGPWKRQCFD